MDCCTVGNLKTTTRKEDVVDLFSKFGVCDVAFKPGGTFSALLSEEKSQSCTNHLCCLVLLVLKRNSSVHFCDGTVNF